MSDIDIKYDPEGNEIIIRAKLTVGSPSSSGKSLVVATTNGFVPVADSNLKVSLNIIKPRS